MKLALNNGRSIVTLKHFRFNHTHYLILCQMQSDQTMCNALLEIEGKPTERQFVPVHALDLEDFYKSSLLNLPCS